MNLKFCKYCAKFHIPLYGDKNSGFCEIKKHQIILSDEAWSVEKRSLEEFSDNPSDEPCEHFSPDLPESTLNLLKNLFSGDINK